MGGCIQVIFKYDNIFYEGFDLSIFGVWYLWVSGISPLWKKGWLYIRALYQRYAEGSKEVFRGVRRNVVLNFRKSLRHPSCQILLRFSCCSLHCCHCSNHWFVKVASFLLKLLSTFFSVLIVHSTSVNCQHSGMGPKNSACFSTMFISIELSKITQLRSQGERQKEIVMKNRYHSFGRCQITSSFSEKFLMERIKNLYCFSCVNCISWYPHSYLR